MNVPIEASDFDALLRLVKKEDIGLTVVGPEDPLAQGIVDVFQKAGHKIFGPTRAAAQIEQDGRTTAPAHTLYDIVRKLREGAQIEMEASGEDSNARRATFGSASGS